MGKQIIRKPLFRLPQNLLATPASIYFPWTLEEALAWSDFLSIHCGVYYQALEKVASFFVTSPNFSSDLTDNELADGKTSLGHVDTIEKLFRQRFKVMRQLHTFGAEMLNWGTTFGYVHIPFRRMLQCPHCHTRRAYLEQYMQIGFNTATAEFSGTCPDCHRSVKAFIVDDQVERANTVKPTLTSIPPSLMKLDEVPFSGQQRFMFDAAGWPWLRDGIMAGDALYLASLPMPMLRAVCTRSPLMCSDDEIFCGKCPSPANIAANFCGWGYPMHMKAYSDVMALLFIERMNQSIVHEHGSSLRVLSPAPQAAAGLDWTAGIANGRGRNEFTGIDLRGFAGQVSSMLDRYRRNPTLVQFLPYPLQQMIMGGDAKTMIMPDMQEYHEKRMLRNLSIPAEFYDPNLSVPGQLFSIRTFIQRWSFVQALYEDLLNWTNRRVSMLYAGRETTITLETPNIYDSKEILTLKQQMWSNPGPNGLADEDFLPLIGIDPKLRRQRLQRQDIRNAQMAESQQKAMDNAGANRAAMQVPPVGAQVQQDQQAAQGQPQSGGAPSAGPGGAPAPAGMLGAPPAPAPGAATMQQFAAKAEQTAQQYAALPEAQLTQAMTQLKATDMQLYDQVQGILKRKRQQAETAGAQAWRQGSIVL